MKRSLVIVVVALTVSLVACKPPVPPGNAPRGIDTCSAPSTGAMFSWARLSPYTSFGPYIGGVNRACAQPNLTASWVSTVVAQGWKLVPLWAGAQAPCVVVPNNVRFTGDLQGAWWAGAAEALGAVDAAAKLGIPAGAPIYYDMESYPPGGACGSAVRTFLTGWTWTLHYKGYRAGIYSSLCAAIVDAAATWDDPNYLRTDAGWIAAWNGSPDLYGFNGTCAISDAVWPPHQRIHQFLGGHNETWGGSTINVDVNAVDAPTYPS